MRLDLLFSCRLCHSSLGSPGALSRAMNLLQELSSVSCALPPSLMTIASVPYLHAERRRGKKGAIEALACARALLMCGYGEKRARVSACTRALPMCGDGGERSMVRRTRP